MEPKYKLKWQLWDWAAKKTFCIKKGTKCPGGRKKWATCSVHLSTFTQSQDKSKLTIQETIPIFAAQAPHVPPESRSYLGTCSVVAAVTQEKRLSYRVSVHCMSVSLLLRFPCSQHTYSAEITYWQKILRCKGAYPFSPSVQTLCPSVLL